MKKKIALLGLGSVVTMTVVPMAISNENKMVTKNKMTTYTLESDAHERVRLIFNLKKTLDVVEQILLRDDFFPERKRLVHKFLRARGFVKRFATKSLSEIKAELKKWEDVKLSLEKKKVKLDKEKNNITK